MHVLRGVNALFLLAALSLTLALFGCVQPAQASNATADSALALKQEAISKCKALCENASLRDVDLGDGPCLSNAVIDDWVCDVAHDIRLPVDNQPENQCQAFREGRAHHFVEVTPECRPFNADGERIS
jgi:hypothetical protein